jgi:hypothetical protein|tara:strand:- start:332 stop:2290 length:1959 start_codon:yes stop_codon:yes gene_type:complete
MTKAQWAHQNPQGVAPPFLQKEYNLTRKGAELARVTKIKRRKEKKQRVFNLKSKYARLWRYLVKKKAVPEDWPVDLSATHVQDYLDHYMQRFKIQEPIEYTKLMGNIGENRCSSQEFKPSKAQALVHAIARGMIKTNSSNRGILAWHSTGSGKTCTLACIMHAYWYTDKRIVMCSSKEGIKANGPKEFVKCLNKFFHMKIDEQAFRKRISTPSSLVNGFTFATLANKVGADKQYALTDKMYLDNAVLLIDEVQNLFKPPPAQQREHQALENFLLTNRNETRNMKVFIATATPGDSISDIVKLLNVVRDPSKSPITTDIKTFEAASRGLISYVNNDNDLTKFPKVNTLIHETMMSDLQLKEYKKKYAEDMKKKTAKIKMPLSRKYSSMTGGDPSKFPSLSSYSPKLAKMVSTILDSKNLNQKHYIYSSFYTKNQPGIRAVELVLQKMGYTKLSSDIAKRNPGPGKRYCMMTTTDLKGVGAEIPILNVFNSDENRDGKLCHLMLASQNFNEGLDLKAIRHIHLLEPLLTKAAVTQTIGRGRRNCSHRQYDDMSQWNVTVHEYYSKLPAGSSVPGVDYLIKEEQGVNASSPVDVYRQILRDNAIDCKTMRTFHNKDGAHTKCTHAKNDIQPLSHKPKSKPKLRPKSLRKKGPSWF